MSLQTRANSNQMFEISARRHPSIGASATEATHGKYLIDSLMWSKYPLAPCSTVQLGLNELMYAAELKFSVLSLVVPELTTKIWYPFFAEGPWGIFGVLDRCTKWYWIGQMYSSAVRRDYWNVQGYEDPVCAITTHWPLHSNNRITRRELLYRTLKAASGDNCSNFVEQSIKGVDVDVLLARW